MNKRTYIRKCVAAMLAAMFLFIYILQGFHNHQGDNTNSSKHHHSGSEQVTFTEKGAKCLVCEFQLAKDGIPVETAEQISLGIPLPQHVAIMPAENISETPLLCEGRGPPAA